MKNTYWVGIVVAALIIGVLVGYGMWGSEAGRLPGLEREIDALQAQMVESKKKVADLEANLGKVINEKLNVEKEIAELKESLAKPPKRGR
jgi:septal ring factor EnvC (AmiA/AmiB activator)